jgi:hypothetical protein
LFLSNVPAAKLLPIVDVFVLGVFVVVLEPVFEPRFAAAFPAAARPDELVFVVTPAWGREGVILPPAGAL